MPISTALLRESVELVAAIDGAAFSPEALVADVVLLAKSWPDESDFRSAVASSVRAVEQARDGKVTPVALEGECAGWMSYHYQLRRRQGEKADMRLVYRLVEGGIEVKGFGHRYRPLDVYRRMMLDRETRL